MFEILPEDLTNEILGWLDVFIAGRASVTCKRFSGDYIWARIRAVHLRGLSDPIEENKLLAILTPLLQRAVNLQVIHLDEFGDQFALNELLVKLFTPVADRNGSIGFGSRLTRLAIWPRTCGQLDLRVDFSRLNPALVEVIRLHFSCHRQITQFLSKPGKFTLRTLQVMVTTSSQTLALLEQLNSKQLPQLEYLRVLSTGSDTPGFGLNKPALDSPEFAVLSSEFLKMNPSVKTFDVFGSHKQEILGVLRDFIFQPDQWHSIPPAILQHFGVPLNILRFDDNSSWIVWFVWSYVCLRRNPLPLQSHQELYRQCVENTTTTDHMRQIFQLLQILFMRVETDGRRVAAAIPEDYFDWIRTKLKDLITQKVDLQNNDDVLPLSQVSVKAIAAIASAALHPVHRAYPNNSPDLELLVLRRMIRQIPSHLLAIMDDFGPLSQRPYFDALNLVERLFSDDPAWTRLMLPDFNKMRDLRAGRPLLFHFTTHPRFFDFFIKEIGLDHRVYDRHGAGIVAMILSDLKKTQRLHAHVVSNLIQLLDFLRVNHSPEERQTLVTLAKSEGLAVTESHQFLFENAELLSAFSRAIPDWRVLFKNDDILDFAFDQNKVANLHVALQEHFGTSEPLPEDVMSEASNLLWIHLLKPVRRHATEQHKDTFTDVAAIASRIAAVFPKIPPELQRVLDQVMFNFVTPESPPYEIIFSNGVSVRSSAAVLALIRHALQEQSNPKYVSLWPH